MKSLFSRLTSSSSSTTSSLSFDLRADTPSVACAAASEGRVSYLALLPSDLKTAVDALVARNAWRDAGRFRIVAKGELFEQSFCRRVVVCDDEILLVCPFASDRGKAEAICLKDQSRRCQFNGRTLALLPPSSLLPLAQQHLPLLLMQSWGQDALTVYTITGERISHRETGHPPMAMMGIPAQFTSELLAGQQWVRVGYSLYRLPLMQRAFALPATYHQRPGRFTLHPFGDEGEERLVVVGAENDGHGLSYQAVVWSLLTGAQLFTLPTACECNIILQLSVAVLKDSTAYGVYSLKDGLLLHRCRDAEQYVGDARGAVWFFGSDLIAFDCTTLCTSSHAAALSPNHAASVQHYMKSGNVLCIQRTTDSVLYDLRSGHAACLPHGHFGAMPEWQFVYHSFAFYYVILHESEIEVQMIGVNQDRTSTPRSIYTIPRNKALGGCSVRFVPSENVSTEPPMAVVHDQLLRCCV